MFKEEPRGKRLDIGAWDTKRHQLNYRHAIRVCDIFLVVHWQSKNIVDSQINLHHFSGDNWLGVQLDQFMSCESNLATNRQTRMLSDLALVGCYNRTAMPANERDRIMLASAKRNLASMAYFGLTEFQKVSIFVQTLIMQIINIAHLSDSRYHNTYLKKHLTFDLRYHSNNIIQPCLVQHCEI